MELSYRGAHYQQQTAALEATNEAQIGTYRGAPLTARYFKRTPQHESVKLTYRGVQYDQGL